jgi:hypothetical protein
MPANNAVYRNAEATEKIQVPEIDGIELDRTLLQTKFLSTHNSYITMKQQGGILSRDLVVEQLNGLEHYPVCIEIDLKKKDGKLHIDHYTSSRDSNDEFTGNFLDELNFIYLHLNDIKKTFDTYPLVISVDTTMLTVNPLNKNENMRLLKESVHECEFNKKDVTKKTFFNFTDYFFERLKLLIKKYTKEEIGPEKIKETIKQYSYIKTPKFDPQTYKDTSLIFLKDILKKDITIEENDLIGLELIELITKFLGGCMSVHTPLSYLMNKVLIRYKSQDTFFNVDDNDGKILHPGHVHLNGVLNTLSRKIKPTPVDPDDYLISNLEKLNDPLIKVRRLYPDLVIKEQGIKKTPDGSVDCNQDSQYKKFNKTIMDLNYKVLYKNINMIAFNWHDICEKDKANLKEKFKAVYYQMKAPPVPRKRSTSNGGSRKRRNLKKKKKKSKRHRRKTRKL